MLSHGNVKSSSGFCEERFKFGKLVPKLSAFTPFGVQKSGLLLRFISQPCFKNLLGILSKSGGRTVIFHRRGRKFQRIPQ